MIKARHWIIFCTSLILATLGEAADYRDDQVLISTMNRYVVDITIKDFVLDAWQNDTKGIGGTGFIVDPKRGIIATNYHVVCRNHVCTVLVTLHDGRTYSGREVKQLYSNPTGTQFDFSLLQILGDLSPFSSLPPLLFEPDPKNIDVGTPIWRIGYAANSEMPTMIRGFISDTYAFGTDTGIDHRSMPRYILSTVSGQGLSGSPVFTNDGEVIGIHAGRYDGKIHGFATPIRYVLQALETIQKGLCLNVYSLGFEAKIEPYNYLESVYHVKDPEFKDKTIEIPG